MLGLVSVVVNTNNEGCHLLVIGALFGHSKVEPTLLIYS